MIKLPMTTAALSLMLAMALPSVAAVADPTVSSPDLANTAFIVSKKWFRLEGDEKKDVFRGYALQGVGVGGERWGGGGYTR